jgi:hypothetical protein
MELNHVLVLSFSCGLESCLLTKLINFKIEANFEQKYKYYIGQDGNGSDPQVH